MANFNMNKVILGGRMTADPELKQTNSGKSVVSFSMAVNRRYQKDGEQKADFISVVAWNQTAEFVAKYFGKGSSIGIVGSIQTRTWEDTKGQKRYATEVIADEAYFVDSKSEAGGSNSGGNSGYVPEQYQQAAPNFQDINSDEELPF